MSLPPLYVSFDVETDGSCPLVNNMLSIGVVFLDATGVCVNTYSATFELLEGHVADPQTAAFWSRHPSMYAAARHNPQPIATAMRALSLMLSRMAMKHTLQFVAAPACFDWMFLKCYYEFARRLDPEITFDIGFKCHCFSSALRQHTVAHGLNAAARERLLEELCPADAERAHDPLYDAEIQGVRYVRLLLQTAL